MDRRRRYGVTAALAALVLASGCEDELVVRTATRLYLDGSLSRTVEVSGRGGDGERPEQASWLAETIGVTAADPDAWGSYELEPGRLALEGFFPSVELLAPALRYRTGSGAVIENVETTLAVDEATVARRFVYRERHGDPLGQGAAAAAVDAMLARLAEVLREEARLELGEAAPLEAIDAFLAESARPLMLTLVLAQRQRGGDSVEAVAQRLLPQFGVPVASGSADAEGWLERQLPLLLDWSREAVAQRMTEADFAVAPDELDFWPGGERWAESAQQLVERYWGDDDAFMQEMLPFVEAFSGRFADGSASFRFEQRVELPGRLLFTDGTPDGGGVVWLFRGKTLPARDLLLNATSIELEREALTELGARRDLDALELLRLHDLLWQREDSAQLRERLASADALDDLLAEPDLPAAIELYALLD